MKEKTGTNNVVSIARAKYRRQGVIDFLRAEGALGICGVGDGGSACKPLLGCGLNSSRELAATQSVSELCQTNVSSGNLCDLNR